MSNVAKELSSSEKDISHYAPLPTKDLAKNIPVLYKKNGIIAAIKPIGMPMFSDLKQNNRRSQPKKSLSSLIQDAFYTYKTISFTPAPCHRLDTTTSGIVLSAYTAAAAREIHALHMEKKVSKVYFALLTHQLSSSTLTHLLFRDTTHKITYAVSTHNTIEHIFQKHNWDSQAVQLLGKVSLTSYMVHTLDIYIENTHVPLYMYAILLKDGGKTHQIRAQCAAEGAAIFGDIKYFSHPFYLDRALKNDFHNLLSNKRCFFKKNKKEFSSFLLHAAAIFIHDPNSSFFSALYAPLPLQWENYIHTKSSSPIQIQLFKKNISALNGLCKEFCACKSLYTLSDISHFLSSIQ